MRVRNSTAKSAKRKFFGPEPYDIHDIHDIHGRSPVSPEGARIHGFS